MGTITIPCKVKSVAHKLMQHSIYTRHDKQDWSMAYPKKLGRKLYTGEKHLVTR